MVSDPISNMLVALKNGAKAGKATIVVPASNLKFNIAKLLEREGYLTNVVKRGKKVKKYLACDPVYTAGKTPKLQVVKRMSKPSRRIYLKADEIHTVRNGTGLSVLSTPKGLLTDKEARKEKVGGELMFMVW
jgi:small subunit ribosomal protein S8